MADKTSFEPGANADSGGVPTSRMITAGTGLTGGGDLSSNRTLALATTGVAAGSYTNASVTFNAYGQATAASSGGGGGGLSRVLEYTLTQISGSYSYASPASTSPSGMPYSIPRFKAPAGSVWRLEAECASPPPSGDVSTLAIAQTTTVGGSFTDKAGSSVTLDDTTAANTTVVGASVTFDEDRWIMPRCGFASDNGNFVHYGTTVVRLIREA